MVSRLKESCYPTNPTVVNVSRIRGQGMLRSLAGATPVDKAKCRVMRFRSPSRENVSMTTLCGPGLFGLVSTEACPFGGPSVPRCGAHSVLLMDNVLTKRPFRLVMGR